MNTLLAVAVVTTVTFVCGCSTVETAGPLLPAELVPTAQMTAATTAELTARRAQVLERIAEIQREVEMKEGLHMGVVIHDDRAKLTELHLEARQIDSELLRRWKSGEGAGRIETVKAEF